MEGLSLWLRIIPTRKRIGRLIAAHENDWAEVGPRIENGNPTTLTIWANFLLCFVEWYGVSDSREARCEASHNSSYKRELLVGLGEYLAESLLSDWKRVLPNSMRIFRRLGRFFGSRTWEAGSSVE